MEPYRPYVDKVVCDIIASTPNPTAPDALALTKEIKTKLLAVPAMDVMIALSQSAKDLQRSPMMIAIERRTTASLARCYEGDARKILYPVMTI
jgi:CRISPR-associated protein Cas1